ncbi:hypothetical protein TSUD_178570 [Trifolium subterraneum]|uniref:Uncharacterized protein n=1 Tax=Trifolium subterraneum TaxID=3900 RepID=A0A2Z6PC96_TRISU|nr:hypothetical protein TSUD_178570 [Trifolium subterraneum]
MLGKGVSREHFQPRTCSTGKNASKTGQKRDLENIVYIDLDCDHFDDVEIIDCPDAGLQKLCGFSGPSRDRTSTPQSVISIDDDDVDHSGIDVDGVGDLDSDASSNKRFSTTSSVRNSVHVDVDDCDCDVYEKDSVSKRQKSKEVFSSKTALRNRYGLYGSEIESSDSDCSDCEVIKREQWEKVSAKRKVRVFNERASSSGLHINIYNNIEVENRSQRHGKGPLYGPSSSNYVKENQSSFTVKDDIWHGEKVYPCPKSKNCNFCNGVTGSTRFKDDIQHGERITRKRVSVCPNSENSNFCNGFTGSSRLEKQLGDKESKFMSSNQDGHDMEVDNDESQLNAHRQVSSDESPLRNKNDNISEENFNGASFDKMNYKGHEFELHTQDADLTASNEKNIINQKEKHKETDLYKQAMEEELASRQRALQIQVLEMFGASETCDAVNLCSHGGDGNFGRDVEKSAPTKPLFRETVETSDFERR